MKLVSRILQYTVCLVMLTLSSYGQPQANELRHALHIAPTDSLKISAYQTLASHYRYTMPDSSIFYAEQGLAFARQRNYKLGEGIMVNAMAQVDESHGHLASAKERYIAANAIFSDIGYTAGMAATSNGLGVVAGKTGNYEEALKYFFQALQLYEKINHTRGVIQSYIKLGVVNDQLGKLKEALDYYLKAEQLNESQPFSNATLTLLNNIGIIYGRRNDIQTAMRYFRKGVDLSEAKAEYTGVHIALLGSLGIAYEKSGKPDSALYYQRRALHQARTHHFPEEEARAMLNIAAVVKDSGQRSDLLEGALAITNRIHQPGLHVEILEALIDLHKQRGNFKEALSLSSKRQAVKDSLFSIQKEKEIANHEATYALAKQEVEIATLAMRNQKSLLQRNIMIGVSVMAIIATGIVWFYNKRMSTLNDQLKLKQRELETSNTVKDKLFSILGHDLRGPLSRVIGLLEVFSLENKSESVILEKLKQQSLNTLETLDNLLVWGESQLKGIRLNKQRLHVKEQIQKTLALHSGYAAQKKIKIIDNVPDDLHVQADPSHFDFVMRNLISNAIKFSNSGEEIEVNSLVDSKQDVIFAVKDSGVGIDMERQEHLFTFSYESIEGTWKEKGTGLGLPLCQGYVTENGGKMWVRSEVDKGSTFYFSLPADTENSHSKNKD